MTTTLSSSATTLRSVFPQGIHASIMRLAVFTFLAGISASPAHAVHHMKRNLVSRQSSGSSTPLVISNNCGETIYPGIVTQSGTGPSSQGFELSPGQNKSQTVSADWQGRVWGRTNCTFNSAGTAQGGGSACGTGDCGGTVNCMATVSPSSRSQHYIQTADG